MGDFHKIQEVLGHLPAAEVADAVVQDVKAGKVGILAAPTGSGKSLLVSARLADSGTDRVLVLMPRRLLVTDAARNIAEMTGTKVGDVVGYALGSKPGEESNYSDHTKLLFCTYGFALSSGLIKKANTVVLDEVHEKSEDITLARAILHQRKRRDPSLHLLEMSATVNAERQAEYWRDVAAPSVYKVETSNLTYDERFVPAGFGHGIAEIAIDLLSEGRKGIAIFMQGSKDIFSVIGALKKLSAEKGISNVEIAPIFGDLEASARREAVMPPKAGMRKIIVGTNVIESGVNLRWVDAGISNGIGKIPYTRPETGAEALVEENLPQWRIVQQRGRINRDPEYSGFDKGIFVLRAQKDMQGRVQDATPEIERVSAVGLVFQAARLNIDPTTMKYDARLTKNKLYQARAELQRLGLMEAEGWRLTEDGRFVARLPVSPEAGAMLCEARRLDALYAKQGKHSRVLYDTITLVSVMECKGLRADYKTSHKMSEKSDLLDGFIAYNTLGQFATSEACARYNVSWKRYHDVSELISELRGRLAQELLSNGSVRAEETRYKELERVILSGGVNRLFMHEAGAFRDVLRGNAGFEAGKSSVAPVVHSSLAVGQLREIQTEAGNKPILEMITRIPEEVFLAWAADCKQPVLTEVHFQERTNNKNGRQKSKHSNDNPTVLRGNYFGEGEISMFVPKHASKQMLADIERVKQRSDHGAGDSSWQQGHGGSFAQRVNERQRDGRRGR